MHTIAEPLQAGQHAILVADDDDAVRRVTRQLLERAGHTVMEAASGREAVALLQASPGQVGLLITDVVMPEMNGIELAAAIRATAPGIPILYVSGHSLETLEHRGLVQPGSAFLQKPFLASALAERVRELLGNPHGAAG